MEIQSTDTGTDASESTEQVAEGEEAKGSGGGLTEANASPEQKAAMQTLKEKFKLTVDGEEFEEEVDWNDKADIKRRLQMAAAAEKRMGEAKTAKSKAFDIVKAFEENPENILKRLGARGREVAEKFLLSQIQEDMMSPEDKAARSEKEELERYRQKDAKTKEESEKSEQSARESKYAQDYQTTIIQALEKSQLPKTPELIKRMAGIMKKNLDLGLDLTTDDLVMEIKKDALGTIKALVKDADGDQLLALLGEDIANKIRKSDLRKLQEKQGQVFQRPAAKATAPSRPKEDRPMTIDEWRETVNQRIK